MAEPRKADKLAGRGSLADRMRRQRIAIESGDPEAAQRIGAGTEEPEDEQYGKSPEQEVDASKPKGDVLGSGKKLKLLKDLLIGKKA